MREIAVLIHLDVPDDDETAQEIVSAVRSQVNRIARFVVVDAEILPNHDEARALMRDAHA
jgi:hypothetical protein